jgi:glycosyltransferase involved in cell wall biosynthesis
MSTGSNPKLTVAIDTQIFAEKGVGGIETVLAGLVNALGKLQGSEEYVLIGPWENPDWLRPHMGSNQRVVRGPRLDFVKRAVAPIRPILRGAKHLLMRSAGVPPDWPTVQQSNGFYESLGCDVIYFPSPRFIKTAMPSVYNPHDLQHMHFPELLAKEAVIWREKISRTGCEMAHTTVAISNWVKNDIVQQYGVDASRIQVIYWGAPTEVHASPSITSIEATLKKYSVLQPFVLFPAMTRPHKNHLGLLDALAELRDRRALALNLVCTGYQNDFWPVIEERMKRLRLETQVKFTGMVSAQELRALYRACEFVVFPSLFEGAGMPVLEAWQDNAPVACSAVTSLPELAGDAARLFDLSVESIATALAEMHTSAALREDLRARGRRRLQDFSWRRTALQYRAVFRRAAGLVLDDEDRELLSIRETAGLCKPV